MEEATPGDEACPYQNEAGQGTERQKRPDGPETAILKERPTTCDMAYPLLEIGYGLCAAEPAPSARLSRQAGRLARTPKYFLSGGGDTGKSPEVVAQDFGTSGQRSANISQALLHPEVASHGGTTNFRENQSHCHGQALGWGRVGSSRRREPWTNETAT